MLRVFLRKLLAITGGVVLGQTYYNYMLNQIPFPGNLGTVVSLVISTILGLGNAISLQMRCVSALCIPMYCGKPGRAVLKAILLTYIVAGPITNMCMNAGEVVRVFACTTQLAENLSVVKHEYLMGPLRKAALAVTGEMDQVKDSFRSIEEVIEPLQAELADDDEVCTCRHENDFIDDLLYHSHRSSRVDRKFCTNTVPNITDLVSFYKKKLSYRCENQISRAVSLCIAEFSNAYIRCTESVLRSTESELRCTESVLGFTESAPNEELVLCWPLIMTEMCDLVSSLDQDMCCSGNQVLPGLENAFNSLLSVRNQFVENTKDIHLQDKLDQQDQRQDTQNANETARLVQNAFSEKITMFRSLSTVVYICAALHLLRIFSAAVVYHDLYLTDIDFDNVYVTRYFKSLDGRKRRYQYVLLPLKKMERNRYTDTQSFSYAGVQSRLVSQILKVMLEVVTATTFVMLDRLFYEALDVVRQHAERGVESTPTRDLEMKVEGTGLLAAAYKTLLDSLQAGSHSRAVSNAQCVLRPILMPYAFFYKIYGGYLWLLLLLFLDPYTARLRRAVCSYFYPRREKQRILHLYNDILKKRMKMHKTLRRKAVQSVRTHYLTGESLLTLRMRFPALLGWLRVLPAARRACLVCQEVEPRTQAKRAQKKWYSCCASKCPFVYCAECWREAGARCLACEPSLAELSDVDSLSDDERPAY